MIKAADRFATPLEYARLSHDELVEHILRRKAELNAVILGHNYQRLEIQAVSDYLGDSLGLSQEAAATEAFGDASAKSTGPPTRRSSTSCRTASVFWLAFTWSGRPSQRSLSRPS